MRSIIKNIYHESFIGYKIIRPFIKIYNFYRFRFLSDKKFVEKKFRKTFGFDLNLEAPKTFNEKINWLKLNDRTDLHTIAADKYAVRDYISKKIGKKYLIPLVFHSEEVNEVIPENFPDHPFIIKANHNSSGGMIVEDKSNFDWKKARFTLYKLMNDNYYYESKEWQYKNIKPCIIAENLLKDSEGNIPYDYKLHCFNGKFVFVHVDIDRQIDHRRNLYDTNWEFIDCVWYYKNGRPIAKPSVFEKMKELAEIIASDFYYVRVDLYIIGSDIYFGELTFHQGSGTEIFTPHQWDIKFGQLLSIPIDNK
tara:strand:- start:981 stop:1904 length:924 start_codon:yes stop_codon:yes gene_type:complete